MKRAWRVELVGATFVVAAETRGRAAARCVKSARDAHYRCSVIDARVRRAPEHDAWAEVDASNALWEESELPDPEKV